MIKKEMLKKLGCIFMVIIFLVVVIGCGKPKEINGLTYGTYGLLNTDDKKNPNNFRPITMINTISKILTSILNYRLIKYCESNNMKYVEISYKEKYIDDVIKKIIRELKLYQIHLQ